MREKRSREPRKQISLKLPVAVDKEYERLAHEQMRSKHGLLVFALTSWLREQELARYEFGEIEYPEAKLKALTLDYND